jgi:hypothetical protein
VTATTRRTVIVTMAALAVAVVLVWSASTGPADLAEGMSSRPVVTHTSQHRDTSASHERTAKETKYGGDTQRPATARRWVQDVAGVLAFVVGMWVFGLVLRAAMRLVGASLPEKQLVVDLDPLPDVEAAREVVHRQRDRLRDALTAGDVRNGIVACWVVLEEAAAEAGVARLPAETPTEFVVRFLHALDVDPRPVAGLAELYREARFSTHPMDEDARTRAHQALGAVLDELDRAGAPA